MKLSSYAGDSKFTSLNITWIYSNLTHNNDQIHHGEQVGKRIDIKTMRVDQLTTLSLAKYGRRLLAEDSCSQFAPVAATRV